MGDGRAAGDPVGQSQWQRRRPRGSPAPRSRKVPGTGLRAGAGGRGWRAELCGAGVADLPLHLPADPTPAKQPAPPARGGGCGERTACALVPGERLGCAVGSRARRAEQARDPKGQRSAGRALEGTAGSEETGGHAGEGQRTVARGVRRKSKESVAAQGGESQGRGAGEPGAGRNAEGEAWQRGEREPQLSREGAGVGTAAPGRLMRSAAQRLQSECDPASTQEYQFLAPFRHHPSQSPDLQVTGEATEAGSR